MTIRPWSGLCLVILFVGCPPDDETLPEVKIGLPWEAMCLPPQYGVIASQATLVTHSTLSECVKVAWDASCEGALAFELDVDAWGSTGPLRFQGSESPTLRRCVTTQVARAVLLPAADCRGFRLPSTVRGSIRWTADRGTGVSFADEAGIVACLRECPLQKTSGAPASGCS